MHACEGEVIVKWKKKKIIVSKDTYKLIYEAL